MIIYYALKRFWFSNNLSFANADPLTHTPSEYQACCCQPWLGCHCLGIDLVFCHARQTRAERSAFDFALALNMNLDTLPSNWLGSRWAAARELEWGHLTTSESLKPGRSEGWPQINLKLYWILIENQNNPLVLVRISANLAEISAIQGVVPPEAWRRVWLEIDNSGLHGRAI